MLKKPKLFSLILIASITLLSGCVYLRLLNLKYQLEHFADNIDLEDRKDGGYAMKFKKPVIYDKDILFITFAPNEKTSKDKQQLWTYHFQKINAPLDKPIIVHLNFNQDKKLDRIDLPERFAYLFPRKQFLSIAKGIGAASIDKSNRKLVARAKHTKSKTGINLTKDKIDAKLGKPLKSAVVDGKTEYFYRYKLKDAEHTIWLRIFFDKSSRIIKMQTYLAGGVITLNLD